MSEQALKTLDAFEVTSAANGGYFVTSRSRRDMGVYSPPLGAFTNASDLIRWLSAELVQSDSIDRLEQIRRAMQKEPTP